MLSRFLLSMGLALGSLAGLNSVAQAGPEHGRTEQVRAEAEQDGWARYGFYQNLDTANQVSQSLRAQGYRTTLTTEFGGYVVWYWVD